MKTVKDVYALLKEFGFHPCYRVDISSNIRKSDYYYKNDNMKQIICFNNNNSDEYFIYKLDQNYNPESVLMYSLLELNYYFDDLREPNNNLKENTMKYNVLCLILKAFNLEKFDNLVDGLKYFKNYHHKYIINDNQCLCFNSFTEDVEDVFVYDLNKSKFPISFTQLNPHQVFDYLNKLKPVYDINPRDLVRSTHLNIVSSVKWVGTYSDAVKNNIWKSKINTHNLADDDQSVIVILKNSFWDLMENFIKVDIKIGDKVTLKGEKVNLKTVTWIGFFHNLISDVSEQRLNVKGNMIKDNYPEIDKYSIVLILDDKIWGLINDYVIYNNPIKANLINHGAVEKSNTVFTYRHNLTDYEIVIDESQKHKYTLSDSQKTQSTNDENIFIAWLESIGIKSHHKVIFCDGLSSMGLTKDNCYDDYLYCFRNAPNSIRYTGNNELIEIKFNKKIKPNSDNLDKINQLFNIMKEIDGQ